VQDFPRFLAALLSNVPDYKLRMPLVENLFEEHGRLNEAYVHCQTYRQFLIGIGLKEEEINRSKPIVPVIVYNRSMIDLCLHYPYAEGLSALGVVEEIVARVSPIIGAFARKEYESTDQHLFHFSSHETLDIAHAQEIYELAALSYTEENSSLILQGMNLGMYYHKQMYTGIWEHIQDFKM
jgi:pyrroloquinoline-quinone synthase